MRFMPDFSPVAVEAFIFLMGRGLSMLKSSSCCSLLACTPALLCHAQQCDDNFIRACAIVLIASMHTHTHTHAPTHVCLVLANHREARPGRMHNIMRNASLLSRLLAYHTNLAEPPLHVSIVYFSPGKC